MYRYLWFLDYLRKAYYTCSSKSVVFTTKRGKMKKQIEILKDTPLFFGVQEHEIEEMLGCLSSSEKTYNKGSYILTAQDPPVNVGIVLEGSVHVIKEDFWGNRAILARIGAGGMFGEAFACAQADHLPVSVVAREDTDVLFIDYKRIITTCSSACHFHSRLIENMLHILAEKNILLTQKMEHIVKRTTREKLLSYLSWQAVQAGSSYFMIPFNRQELADYLSVDRSALSSELGKLQKEGILEYHKNQFKLIHT